MNRIYVVQDVHGERKLDEQALPLSLGGDGAGDIVMPGVPADQRVAFIAVSDGHAYIQAADRQLPLFHNHERLDGSRWLKSGDVVQLDDAIMSWTVQGDQVIIKTQTRSLATAAPPGQIPPLVPPPRALPEVVEPVQHQAGHRKRG